MIRILKILIIQEIQIQTKNYVFVSPQMKRLPLESA